MFSVARTVLLSFSRRPVPEPREPSSASLQLSRWGEFEILEQLGSGTFGTVYRARNTRLGREVALKLFHGSSGHLEEARKLASLPPHKNIVVVFWCGEFGGIPGIEMELIDGETLESILAREGRLKASAVPVLSEICTAVDELHSHGLVHRDIKAQNVMRERGGRILVMDLGLAEWARDSAEPCLAGTLPYMAPELFDESRASVQSDIYSLGILFFHLLTGAFPVNGGSIEDYREQHRKGTDIAGACRITGVSGLNARIIAKACDPHPKRRYVSVAALQADLERVAERFRRRRRALAAVLVTTAIAGGGTLAARRVLPHETPLTQVTSYEGYTTDPDLSADGKWLAFASDKSGRGDSDIYVQPAAGGVPVRVTDHPAHERRPSLSPDGTSVAYRSDRDGGSIYVRPVRGGAEHLLAQFANSPRYSPDGTNIAYEQSDEGNLARPHGRIFVISPYGGQPHRLFSEFADARYPAWISPTEILFQGCPAGCSNPETESDWWIGSLSGARARATGAFGRLRRQSLDLYFAPVSVAEGNIYFGARRLHSTNIWRMPITSRLMGLLGRAEQITSSTEENAMPAATADGTVYFSASSARVSVWMAGLASDAKVRRLTNFPEIDSMPSISADGKRILYFRRRGNSRSMVLMEGSQERTRPIEAGSRGILRADGRAIVFSRPSVHGREILIQENLDAVPRQVCDGCGEVVDIAPDGGHILAAADSRIYLIDTAAGARHVLLSEPGRSIDQAAFSPDGRWLVWLAVTDQDHSQVMIAPWASGTLDLQHAVAITDNERWNDRPRWMRDGKGIVFISARDDFRCIWSQRLDSEKRPLGTPRHLVGLHEIRNTLHELTRNALNLSVSEDGVLFNTALNSGGIWMTAPR